MENVKLQLVKRQYITALRHAFESGKFSFRELDSLKDLGCYLRIGNIRLAFVNDPYMEIDDQNPGYYKAWKATAAQFVMKDYRKENYKCEGFDGLENRYKIVQFEYGGEKMFALIRLCPELMSIQDQSEEMTDEEYQQYYQEAQETLNTLAPLVYNGINCAILKVISEKETWSSKQISETDMGELENLELYNQNYIETTEDIEKEMEQIHSTPLF